MTFHLKLETICDIPKVNWYKKGEAGEKSLPSLKAIGGLAGIVVGGGLIFVLGMLYGKREQEAGRKN